MSQLGKILLGVALLGALASLVAGYLVIQKSSEQKGTIASVTQERDSVKAQVSKATQQADAAEKDKAAAVAELTESKTKLDDLTAKLASAQKDHDDLTSAVQTANDATKKAQDQVQQITTSLGMSPDEAKAAIKKAQDDLATTQSEQKILQDQLQASTSQIEELKKDINNAKVGFIPPGVSGKVTFVNRAWNFVVLNIGLTNGVVPNGELIVYRGRTFLGKIKVTSAEGSTAVADILPDAKADIQVGDDVLN
jgi:predicted RNase H-like nuclease (RuvC/YqgF family)